MATVLAAILDAYGSVPRVGEWSEPEGATAAVLAAGLNPVDVRIASGTFYGGAPEVPYVPGGECVAAVDGRRFYVLGPAAFAEQVALPGDAVELPDGVDDALAVACGTPGTTAWVALDRARLVPGESVLVLGASGAVGAFAVQLAGLRGAGRVVGAARSGPWVGLDEVAEHGPFDVVIDPLWGAAAEAAAAAMAPGGRLVQLGQSAGETASFSSPVVRGNELELLGLALPRLPREERLDAYFRVVQLAAAGELSTPTQAFALADVADAWALQASGSPGAKLVLVP
jgi:NADPH2:quinone reductase